MSAARLTVSPLPRSTPLGRRATLLGLGLLFAGLNTGNNLFYLLFALLASAELVGSLAAGRVLRHARAQVLLPGRARVGDPLRVTLHLENRSRRLSLPALCWQVTAGGDRGEVWTPPLPAGASGSGTGRLVPARRGRLRLERVEARTDYPVGLARRLVRLDPGDADVLVTPRLVPGRRATPGSRRGDLRTLTRPRGQGEEPGEAREYLPGDDARQIDWKASARSGRLTWRDRRGDPPIALQVRLDRSGRAGEGFEERVSQVASAAVRALSRGAPVGFVSDEVAWPPRSGPAQRRRILDYLALVQPAGGGGAAG